jgi:hypothetical protein
MVSEASASLGMRLRNTILLGGPLLGTLIIAQVTLSGAFPKSSSGYAASNIDILTPGFVSVFVIVGLLYALRRRGEQAARLAVSGITVSGTLAGLVLLQLSFAASGTLPVLLYLPAAPLTYLGLYWSFRNYMGTLSPKRVLLLTLSCVTLLGTLIGVLFPLAFTIPLLFGLSILDALVVETNLLKRMVSAVASEKIISATTLPFTELEIGLGDLLAYSMLVAGSLHSIGVYAGAESTILILVGTLITFRIARSRLRFPGLPIPIGLGMVPSIVGLLIR